MPPDDDLNSPAIEGGTAPDPVTSSQDQGSTAQDTPNSGDNAAPSPSAQGETKESLLDAVLKAVPPKSGQDGEKTDDPERAAPGSTEPQDGSDPDKPKAEAKPTGEDPTPEEMARYTSNTRERIKSLMAQRNEARRERDALMPQVQIATGLREFLTQNDIGKEDFSVLLDLGVALRKGDFRTFYQGVLPYVELAEEALGLTISPDLRQQVEQGHMTTEAAKRFTQERISRQLADSTAQKAQAQLQTATQAHQTQALQTAVASAVGTWEAGIRQSDPDYGQKQELVRNMLWSVISEVGSPQNPQQAVLIAQEAYRRVNDAAARFRPAPKPTQAVPSSLHRAAGAKAEPKSLMEAAMQGLETARQRA